MSIEVLVPNLPESVSDATLISWHKQAGDTSLKMKILLIWKRIRLCLK